MNRILHCFLCLSILITTSQCTHSSNTKNDLTAYNLKGKVKSVREEQFDAVSKIGKVEKGDLLFIEYYSFNEKGNSLEYSRYNKNEALIEKTIFSYNENGTLKESRKVFGLRYSVNGPNRPQELNDVFLYEYNYNNDGKLNYSLVNTPPNQGNIVIGDSTVYFYDRAGNLEKSIAYSRSSLKNQSRDVYVSVYNNQEQEIELAEVKEFFEERLIDTTGDKIGWLKELRDRIEKGTIYDTIVVKRDTLYKIQSQYSNNQIARRLSVFYSQEPNGTNKVLTVSEYNKQGDVISEVTESSASKHNEIYDPNVRETYTYQYDSKGNWTSKIYYSNGIAKAYYIRIYEYY